MASGQWKDAQLDLSDRKYTEELFAGLPSRDLGLAQSDDGKVIVGMFEAVAGTSTFTQAADEFGYVVSGGALIEVEGEPALEIGPGDAFFIPAGRNVTWHVTGSLRKFYAVRIAG